MPPAQKDDLIAANTVKYLRAIATPAGTLVEGMPLFLKKVPGVPNPSLLALAANKPKPEPVRPTR